MSPKLEEVVKKAKNGRPVQVRAIRSIEEAGSCHVLYITD